MAGVGAVTEPNGQQDPFGRDPFERERDERVSQASRASRPYLIVIGLIFVGLAAFATFSSLDRDGPGAEGLEPGVRMPRFAAPSATGDLRGDANVSNRACRVRDPDAIRICDYFDRPLVLVAWFSRCQTCSSQLDTVERLRRRYPGVAFVGLNVADSIEEAGAIVRDRGWTFPVASDPDGAVGLLYGVLVGPTTYLAYPGGVVRDTIPGELDERELSEQVRRLVRTSKRRANVRAAGARP
jgi:peroxiredoxin